MGVWVCGWLCECVERMDGQCVYVIMSGCMDVRIGV